MKLYGIIGAGGFGREIMPLINNQLRKKHKNRHYKLVFVTEDDISYSTVNGYPILHMVEFLNSSIEDKYFNIAIANYSHRRRIAEYLISLNIHPFSIYAPNYVNLGNSEIDIGAIFCAFTFISPNARIGKFFHANIYSYIAHDCVISDFVTFAPKVCCNGGVSIEENVYVGTGAIIKQSTSDKPIIIGKGATIGMGAIVTKSVPPYTTVIGNPAKPLLTDNILC